MWQPCLRHFSGTDQSVTVFKKKDSTKHIILESDENRIIMYNDTRYDVRDGHTKKQLHQKQFV